MGLFSTKKKKKFYTAVQRMVDDDNIVLSSKSAVTNWLFTPQSGSPASLSRKGLPDFLMEATMASLPNKFNRAYRMAKAGRYAYGLPLAANVSQSDADIPGTVKSVLEAQESHPVTLLYAYMEEANYHHFMWKILIEDYGYNPDTNELEQVSLAKGFPCYLDYGYINYNQATMDAVEDWTYFSQWGLSTEYGQMFDRERDLSRAAIPYDIDPDAPANYAFIQYQYDEVIPDTTNPDVPIIESFDGTILKGVSEKLSEISVYDGTTLLATATVDDDGKFEITLDTEILTEISIVAKDTVDLESDPVLITSPYEGTDIPEQGTEPTQTVFRRTEHFNFDFLQYINSDNPDDDAPPVDEPTYIMAGYTVEIDGVTHVKYLTYAENSNTISEFESIIQFGYATGEFFPRLYARLNGTNLATSLSKTDPRYKSSVRLAKELGFDWTSWVNQLHDAIDDVGSVQQLFITECAPLNTDDPVISEYLYRYFSKIYNEKPVPAVWPSPAFIDPFNIKDGLALQVSDAAYSHYVSFSHIGMDTITGSIGAVGTYSCTYVPQVTKTRLAGGIRIIYEPVKNPYHSIKHQITATQYREIRVYNASSHHSFSGGGTTVTGTDEALVIPLDRSALPHMTQAEKEILFSKCLHLFINVVKVIKTKWYQRGAFKVLAVIVAITISVVSVGTGAPISTYIIAAVSAIAIGYAVGVAIQLLAKVLVKLGVNAEVVATITTVIVVLAIFAGAKGVNVGNITPSVLLQIANAGFQVAGRMNAMGAVELAKQMDTFYSDLATREDALEKARDLLETGTVPLSFELIMGDVRSKIFIHLGESPESYLNRVTGLNNIAGVSTEMTSNYVDLSLTLPDFYSSYSRLSNDGEEYV